MWPPPHAGRRVRARAQSGPSARGVGAAAPRNRPDRDFARRGWAQTPGPIREAPYAPSDAGDLRAGEPNLSVTPCRAADALETTTALRSLGLVNHSATAVSAYPVLEVTSNRISLGRERAPADRARPFAPFTVGPHMRGTVSATTAKRDNYFICRSRWSRARHVIARGVAGAIALPRARARDRRGAARRAGRRTPRRFADADARQAGSDPTTCIRPTLWDRPLRFVRDGCGGLIATVRIDLSARLAEVVPRCPAACRPDGGAPAGGLDYHHPFSIFPRAVSATFGGAVLRYHRDGAPAGPCCRFDEVHAGAAERKPGAAGVMWTPADLDWNDMAVTPVFLPSSTPCEIWRIMPRRLHH